MQTYSGFTTETAQSLLLDAGAYFKNFEVGKDTFESAVTGGKLLGATRGGGEFSAVPAVRQIEVDGVKGKAKGLENIDSWDVYIKANVLEVKKDTLKTALCASKDGEAVEDYDVIEAKNNIELTDYIDNITWVGTLSGSDAPVIIQVYNAINTDGLKLQTQDKNESVLAMTFYGHYTQDDLNTPPFKVYYPKAKEEPVEQTSGTNTTGTDTDN